MESTVSVILGPARSGKTTRLLSHYRQVLAGGEFGRGLWLAPTHRAVDEVRARLIWRESDGSGNLATRACLKPNCFTFAQFAEAVVQQSPLPLGPIDAAGKRQIIRRLINERMAAGKLVHFAKIADKPGLVDLVSGLFADLKRQEIWPDDFLATFGRRASGKDGELAELYDAYQRLLNEHQLYDPEGRFWSAREQLRKGHFAPFEEVATVVVDGFTDFTRTQHEILEILAARASQMVITLPWDEPTGERGELFHKCRATLAELERRHPHLKQEILQPDFTRGDGGSLAHVERNLFKDPRRIRSATAADGVEIIAAGGQLGELESIAQTIKQLLVEGDAGACVRPSDVVVVFRSTTDVAALVTEVFCEFGIPTSVEASIPLGRAPIFAALRAVLQLRVGDWPFRGLLTVLGHNYLQPQWPQWQRDNCVAAEQMIRSLQIPQGREALLRAIERSANVELPEDAKEARARRRKTAQAARALLSRLSETLEALPREATAIEWGKALVRLCDELGLSRAMADDCGAPLAKFDRDAWELLLGGLEASQQLETQLDGRPTLHSLSALIDRLDEIAAATALPSAHDDTGRVCVLSAASVRTLDVPYLFVAGLSERAFPAPFGEHHLYSAAECRRMNEAGLRFVDSHEWGCQEMLLFYEVVTRATRRLTLSYPAIDEKAQPLSPSPYLLELERLFANGAINRHDETSLSPVARDKPPACLRDLRVSGVAKAIDGDGKLAAALVDCGSANLFAALRATGQRAKREAFGPFEGLLLSEAAQRRLGERFGDDHCWSTSRLEDFLYCPFKFFAERVLGLKVLDELVLEVDHLRRGWRVHELLAEVHRGINAAGGPCSPTRDEETVRRLIAEALKSVMDSQASDGPLGAAWDELDLRMISAWLAQYVEQHRNYDNSFTECDGPPVPKHFEVSFGPVGLDDSETKRDPLSTKSAYELRCGEIVVRLSGRIDRLDVGMVGGRVVFNVLDYKIGAANHYQLKDIESGAILQLPLYAMAVQDLVLAGENAVPWAGGYWHVKDGGYRDKHALRFHEKAGGSVRPTEAWERLREELIDRVGRIVRAVRRGQFPMHCEDEKCTGMCEFRTVCRVGTVRAIEKSWALPIVPIPNDEVRMSQTRCGETKQ
jgi:ATP-dependent helicase/DNAse subunit B